MLDCWRSDAADRPTFSNLIDAISGVLEGLADYLDVNTFSMLQTSTQLDESTKECSISEVIENQGASGLPTENFVEKKLDTILEEESDNDQC